MILPGRGGAGGHWSDGSDGVARSAAWEAVYRHARDPSAFSDLLLTFNPSSLIDFI
jgi:hypothetical protein